MGSSIQRSKPNVSLKPRSMPTSVCTRLRVCQSTRRSSSSHPRAKSPRQVSPACSLTESTMMKQRASTCLVRNSDPTRSNGRCPRSISTSRWTGQTSRKSLTRRCLRSSRWPRTTLAAVKSQSSGVHGSEQPQLVFNKDENLLHHLVQG